MSRDFRTVVELIDGLRAADPETGITLIDSRGGESRFSWPELHTKVRHHAAWLALAGVGRGDRVIVCPTNDPDVLCSFLALFMLGAVPLSVSGIQLGQEPGSQLAFIAHLVEASGAKGVFTQPALISGNDEKKLIPSDLLIDFVPSSLALDDEPPAFPPVDVDEDDLALVQFSSGSTSRPKGVKLTHRNAISNLRILSKVTRRPDEVCVSWLPLYHDMGLMGVLFASFWFPARRQIIMNPVRFLMKPIVWLEQISTHRARVSVVPNFALDLCTDRITEKQLTENRVDLSALETIFVGAEPVRPSSLRRFEERFCRWGLPENVLTPVYGMAEATLIVTAPEFREPVVTRVVNEQEIPSVGRPLFDFQLKVSSDDGRELEPGQVGELWLKGSSVTEGYLGVENDRELFQDGWLRTGDLGTRDEEGRVFITGRIKDLIIISGKNYFAHDIVAELERLPFIERGKVHVFALNIEGREQVAVLSVPLSRMTPEVREKIREFRSFVEQGGPQGWLKRMPEHHFEQYVERLISSDRVELNNEIKRYVLACFGIPVHDVVFVPKIPRTTSGKIRRADCERIYLSRREEP